MLCPSAEYITFRLNNVKGTTSITSITSTTSIKSTHIRSICAMSIPSNFVSCTCEKNHSILTSSRSTSSSYPSPSLQPIVRFVTNGMVFKSTERPNYQPWNWVSLEPPSSSPLHWHLLPERRCEEWGGAASSVTARWSRAGRRQKYRGRCNNNLMLSPTTLHSDILGPWSQKSMADWPAPVTCNLVLNVLNSQEFWLLDPAIRDLWLGHRDQWWKSTLAPTTKNPYGQKFKARMIGCGGGC